MELKGKILAKKGDNKAFKLDDNNWYNLNDPVIPYLEKINKGDEVVVTFEKKGISRYVSKLTNANTETSKEEKTSELKESEIICPGCGKPKKKDNFEVCYMCNKKGIKPKTEENKTHTKTYYDNPEKTAQIQRGNAINAASYAASGTAFNDPEVAAQFVLELAERFLEWLRAE